MNTLVEQKPQGIIAKMAANFDMDPARFEQTIKATVMPNANGKPQYTNEQFAAFLMVAQQYDLNPLTKEIYAFPANGGIQPIVSVDGWANLINSHPEMDGITFDEKLDDSGKVISVTCSIYRKDRNHPCVVTEYLDECVRGTEPWKKWPKRMLRHKALIQCARIAFGFAGIYDEDEVARMRDVTPAPTAAAEITEALKSEELTDAEIIDDHSPSEEPEGGDVE